MRVKMSSAPASANTMNTMTPSWANTALRRSLHTFVREANDAAIALYTIFQLCSAPFDLFGTAGLQRDIAHHFLRIAGVLSSVLSSCDLDALPDEVKSHLNAHVQSCQPLLRKIDQAVEQLHAHYTLSERRAEKVAPTFAAFGRDEDKEVMGSLEKFFNFALSMRLCETSKEPAACGFRDASTVDPEQKVPLANMGCLLQKVDKSLLRQYSALFEALYPTPKRQNPFATFKQNQNEVQQSSQPTTKPQGGCYLFANNNTGAAAQNVGSPITSFPNLNHPSASFHGFAQPNNVSQSPFGHVTASTDGSDDKPATNDNAQEHHFAAYCERGGSSNHYQPQISGHSADGADSESALIPPTPVQAHYFPIAGSYPKLQVQSLLFPQPQRPSIFSCHPPTHTTTTTTNMANDKPSLFGGLGANQTPAKSAFGGNPSGDGGFGGNSSTGCFGGNSSTTAGGLFGGTGSTTAGGLFGGNTSATTGSLFGGNRSTSAGGLFGGTGSATGGGLFGQRPAATVVASYEHLEAYILRPNADSTNNASTWSYKVETLLLDTAAMQAHNAKLGPTYSVIDAIGLLQPQQLHLVQEHVKSREGKLVSVQFGAASDMPTPTGSSMRVQSVIFLLKTSKSAAQQQQGFPLAGKQYSCWMPPPASAAQPTSLFGNNANTANANDGGLFGLANNPPRPSPFGPNTGGNYLTYTQVQSKGDELCTHIVQDGTSGTAKQRYMTLPAYWQHPTKSFEEARVGDYQNGFVHEAAQSKAGGLFGGASTGLFANCQQPASAGLFSAAQQPASTGLFATSQQPASTGLFAATQPASSGLFATSQQPTSTPHFGGWGQKAAISQGLSLFASPAPTPANTPFTKPVNETNAPSPSPFASLAANPRFPNFAASATPTKPPPNPFANVSATTAILGQTSPQSSSSPSDKSEDSSAAGAVDGKSASPNLAFKATPAALMASASKPRPATQAQVSGSAGSSNVFSSFATPAEPSSLFADAGRAFSFNAVGGGSAVARQLDSNAASAPTSEMSRLLIEANKADASADGGDEAAKENGKVEETEQNKEKKKVSFVEEKEGIEQKADVPQKEEKKDTDAVTKEDAEYDHCGDVAGKTDRAE